MNRTCEEERSIYILPARMSNSHDVFRSSRREWQFYIIGLDPSSRQCQYEAENTRRIFGSWRYPVVGQFIIYPIGRLHGIPVYVEPMCWG